eukprot:9682526-Alexandrium_andersonii.AAC.1
MHTSRSCFMRASRPCLPLHRYAVSSDADDTRVHAPRAAELCQTMKTRTELRCAFAASLGGR